MPLVRARKTKTVTEIEHILQSEFSPLSLDQIHTRILQKYPKTAYSTVYRIIERLESKHSVVQVNWKERGSRYEWSGHKHHHHLICEECKCVKDISDELLDFNEKKIGKHTGYTIKYHSIELLGICKSCQHK